MREALSSAQAECRAAEAKVSGQAESLAGSDAAVHALRAELERVTRQLVHASAAAAVSSEATEALGASQAECARLRAERDRLAEGESRRQGAQAAGVQEMSRQLDCAVEEAQGLRAKLALAEVDARQTRWSLSSAEDAAQQLTAQLADAQLARAEAERLLRAARSGAAIAQEAEARSRAVMAEAAAAVTLPMASTASSSLPSHDDAVEADAAAALRAERDALKAALGAAELELKDFAEQVLADSETMHNERDAMRLERDQARAEAADAQQAAAKERDARKAAERKALTMHQQHAPAPAAMPMPSTAPAAAAAPPPWTAPPADQPPANHMSPELAAALSAAEAEAVALEREMAELETERQSARVSLGGPAALASAQVDAALQAAHAARSALHAAPPPARRLPAAAAGGDEEARNVCVVALDAVRAERNFLVSALRSAEAAHASAQAAPPAACGAAQIDTPQQRLASLEEAMTSGAERQASSATAEGARLRVEKLREALAAAERKQQELQGRLQGLQAQQEHA